MVPEADEVELKLAVPVDRLDAVFEALARAAQVAGAAAVARPDQHLDAVYWDTPTLDLLSRGATVRRRTGEDARATWTVKVPTDVATWAGLTRREINHRDDALSPPEVVLARVTAVDAQVAASLVPVARVVSDRRRLQVEVAGVAVVGVDLDRVRGERHVESAAGVAGTEVTFAELELELDAGADPALVGALVAAARGAGAAAADPVPKLARVVRP